MASAGIESFKELGSYIQEHFTELRDEKHNRLCDTILDVGTDDERKSFKINSYLFALHSRVFRNQLFGAMMESQPQPSNQSNDDSLDNSGDDGIDRKYVRINDITPATMSFLVDFFYGLQPSITNTNVANILYAAMKYLIKPLENASIHFVVNNVRTELDLLLPILSELSQHNLSDAISTIVSESSIATALIESDSFVNLPSYIAVELIALTIPLNVSEEEIFQQCVEWCKNNTTHSSNVSAVKCCHTGDSSITPLSKRVRLNSDGNFDEKSESDSAPIDKNLQCNSDWIDVFHRLFHAHMRYPAMDATFFVQSFKDCTILSTEEYLEIANYKLDSNQCQSKFNTKPRRVLENICFDLYCESRVQPFKNQSGVIFLTHDSVSGCSVGWNSGIHKWSIKILAIDEHDDHSGFGYTTNVDAFRMDQDFDIYNREKIGQQYYGFSSGLIFLDESEEYRQIPIESPGGTVDIILNCEEWSITFSSRSGDDPVSIPIQPSLTYYPFVTASAGDCFELA